MNANDELADKIEELVRRRTDLGSRLEGAEGVELRERLRLAGLTLAQATREASYLVGERPTLGELVRALR